MLKSKMATSNFLSDISNKFYNVKQENERYDLNLLSILFQKVKLNLGTKLSSKACVLTLTKPVLAWQFQTNQACEWSITRPVHQQVLQPSLCINPDQASACMTSPVSRKKILTNQACEWTSSRPVHQEVLQNV